MGSISSAIGCVNSFDNSSNLVDMQTYGQIAFYKGILVTALRYIGYLLISIGIYVHAQDLKQTTSQ